MITESEKWQRILIIVNQRSELLLHNFNIFSARQFKKLVIKRLFVENSFVFLLQYIGLQLNTLTLHRSPLWLATGTTCAYLFLRGYSVVPGILLGSFFGFYLENIGFWLAWSCAAILTLQGVLLLQFNCRFLIPTLIFNRKKIYIQFILFIAVLTALTSLLFISIGYLPLSPTSTTLQYWLQSWLANFNAILIFSCALVTWDAYFPDFYALKSLKNSFLLFGLLLFFIMALIFSSTPVFAMYFALAVFLTILFISRFFGWCGAVSAVFLLGILLCLGRLLDAAVFSLYSESKTLLLVQIFLCMNGMLGYIAIIR